MGGWRQRPIMTLLASSVGIGVNDWIKDIFQSHSPEQPESAQFYWPL